MRILIPTHSQDIHAWAVALTLRAQGHEACLWHGADYPTLQSSSMFISEDAPLRWEVQSPGFKMTSEPFDVVWNRRPVPPVLPADMHPGDRLIARRECTAFSEALWGFVSPGAFWVNSRDGRRQANSKPGQLMAAAQTGLRIPHTLCSNDPGEIRRFLRKFEGEVVFKAFTPAQWTLEEGLALLFTSNVTEDDLPDDEVLRLSPGIFQRRVEKDHELRVTFMGDVAVTAKLRSQDNPVSKLDWRAAFADIPVERAELPPEIHRACIEMMKRLGIVFGCVDFIVTPEGEHIFLELNEMGQFLWLEELNPEIKILDCFCNFLTQRRTDFHWAEAAASVSFLDIRDLAMQQDQAEASLHVAKPNYHEVQDTLPATGAAAEKIPR